MLRRIDQKFEAATISPVRSSGPPRRSFGPRRNLQDVTCYACGQKKHYARDCKGATFSSLPINKQNEITGALNNAPLGDFTMAVVWEQFAPTNSQSLDESLDNLHHWAMGAPLSHALVPVLATQSGLTVASQVEFAAAPLPLLPSSSKVPALHRRPSPTRVRPFGELPLRAHSSTLNVISRVRTRDSLRRGW